MRLRHYDQIRHGKRNRRFAVCWRKNTNVGGDGVSPTWFLGRRENIWGGLLRPFKCTEAEARRWVIQGVYPQRPDVFRGEAQSQIAV